MPSLPLTLVFTAYTVSLVCSYTWPNPKLDALDHYLFDETFITQDVEPCDLFTVSPDAQLPGRSNAADWLRTAYHDAATYNVEDGTGGVDASIQYELDRAEVSFVNTLGFLAPLASRYVSVADLLAIGAIQAVQRCGGPQIPFRGGRIDATSAGAPGVPEPQQDLDSHIASFARQGFNQTEMIALVACGHTYGGVQRSAFPDTVPAGTNASADVQASFDSTPVTFNNDVALGYINGTTTNPLVVGHNDTTNSDKRIFSSDGNTTMNVFAKSNDFFKATCSKLIARMLDTVPAGVQLTDVINPLPVKPTNMQLTYTGHGTLRLEGWVRFWGMQEDDSRTVSIKWAPRDGQSCANCSAPMVQLSSSDNSVLYGVDATPAQFLDETEGLSKVWFEVTESGSTRVEDQGGIGFSIQDRVLLADASCEVNATASNVTIAVRGDASPSRVYTEWDAVSSRPWIVTTKSVDATLLASGETYDLYSLVDRVGVGAFEDNFYVAADVDGEKVMSPLLPLLDPCSP